MSIDQVENEQFSLFLEQFNTYESYLDKFVSDDDINYLGISNFYFIF